MDLVMQDEKRVTVDMSGMGGGYEQTCQRMLWLGLQMIGLWPEDTWKGVYSYQGVYGLVDTHASKEIQALEDVWRSDPEISKGGMTGAQHQCVLSHLQYLHKNGYEKWLDVFKNTPSRKFLIVDPPMI